MRITKGIAGQIATKLLAAKKKDYDDRLTAFKAELYNGYMSVVPKSVLKMYADFPSFVNTAGSLCLHYGARKSYVGLPKLFPSGVTVDIFTKSTEGKKMAKRWFELQDEMSMTYKFRLALIEQLTRLRTFKNVQDKFPEAAKHLPDFAIPAKMPKYDTLDALRAKLKN